MTKPQNPSQDIKTHSLPPALVSRVKSIQEAQEKLQTRLEGLMEGFLVSQGEDQLEGWELDPQTMSLVKRVK